MADGYDPRKSKVSNDTMERWRVGAITANLADIPGIGPAAIKKLAAGDKEDRVTNTYQLFGKFLMLKGPDDEDHSVSCMEHTEKFWQWLKNKGVSAHRSAIVKAVAEKAANFFPGIYDANDWENDDDDEE